MHPHAVPPNQKGKPWPAYFIVRTTGEVVPLIAVDELPPGTDLVGVPHSLDLEDTIGMLNLGLQRSSGAFYQVVSLEGKGRVENDAVKVNKPTTEPTSSERSTTHQSSTTPTSTPPATPKAALTHISRGQAPSISISSTANTTAHQAQAHSQPQTQLCRHWCHHGICKWGQQCRYRHIMPMSTSGLQEVGLADWPVWFRRVNPGYVAAEAVDLNSNSSSNLGRARGRRAAKVCMSAGGNGGACCGGLYGPGGIGRERVRESERERQSDRIRGERVIGTASARERGAGAGRVLRSEELGEQIIAKLRGMSREHAAKEKGAEKVGDRLSSSSLIERAAAKDTKTWEDESDDDGDGAESERSVDEKEEDGKGKGKLVDV